MKTIGFPISRKENELRRALIPAHLSSIRHAECLFIEAGYGTQLGFSDEAYARHGVRIVTREEALAQPIVCDPKVGDAEYLSELSHQTIFGWIHAVQNRDITDRLIDGKLTAYAWEDMYYKGRHLFWRNNEIAGEAAILHAYLCHGVFPYNTKVAVLGRGNIARGAVKTLNYMGADVTVYDRHTEVLFREELPGYDVVVNAILWDTTRKDHIIYREDLSRMKPGAMIIDVSCDRAGGIETSIPTSIENPLYSVDGIAHYVVDHTPALFYKTTSESLSETASAFFDLMIEDQENEILTRAKIMDAGYILDERILKYQNRQADFF